MLPLFQTAGISPSFYIVRDDMVYMIKMQFLTV